MFEVKKYFLIIHTMGTYEAHYKSLNINASEIIYTRIK